MKGNMTKIVIVACLIVVAGAAIYFVNGWSSQSKADFNNATVSNAVPSNQSVQNSSMSNSTQTTTQKAKPKEDTQNLISASKAISITKAKSGAQGDTRLRFTASLVKNGGKPYYLITVYDNEKSSDTYGWAIGGAKVDARTGAFLGGMG